MTHAQIWLLTGSVTCGISAAVSCAIYFTLSAVQAARRIRDTAGEISAAGSEISRILRGLDSDCLPECIHAMRAAAGSTMAASEQLRDLLEESRGAWPEAESGDVAGQLAASVAKLFARRGAR
jgi:hypothetical protein